MDGIRSQHLPPSFCYFWGHISSSIGDEAAIRLLHNQNQDSLFGGLKSESRLTGSTASSSFIELKASNPASFHSPLSLKNMEAGRMQPWTDAASVLMNLRVFWLSCGQKMSLYCVRRSYSNIVQAPFNGLLCQALPLDGPAQWTEPFGGYVDIRLGLRRLSHSPANSMYGRFTSTVSKTFTTPGWRRVRSLRRALRARGNRALFALTSKEKMLHLEPSS